MHYTGLRFPILFIYYQGELLLTKRELILYSWKDIRTLKDVTDSIQSRFQCKKATAETSADVVFM